MNLNQQIVEEFFSALAARNPEGMASCYHADAIFRDPVFGMLHGSEIGNMWRMLVETGDAHLQIEFFDIRADLTSGSAKWTARYTFPLTGKHISNEISSQFEFSDGLIIRHTDYFNLWKWSQQAFGIRGYLFGW